MIPANTRFAVLALSDLGSAFEDFDVTLCLNEDAPDSYVALSQIVCQKVTRQDVPTILRRTEGPSSTPAVPDEARSIESDIHRIYFLESSQGPSFHGPCPWPVACHLVSENERVRIFLDDTVSPTSQLADLIQAVSRQSISYLGRTVESLVGHVADIDHDRRFAIVLSPEVEKLGNGKRPVKGLTRRSDFQPGQDRPASNQSDAIFLTTNMSPGEELNAVLAHEWCHAAVFSRMALHDAGPVTSDDDWLNEGLAHIVEVRASNSLGNLERRIRDFNAHTETSPLVVRDYYQSEFWRHDGCRGAAFLFLNWCLDQSGDELLLRLLGSPSLTVEVLESATGKSFVELFTGWTLSMAQSIANQSLDDTDRDDRNSNCVPQALHWKPGATGAQTRTVSMRGGSAAFVRLDCEPFHKSRHLSVRSNRPDRMHISVIIVPDQMLK